MEKYFSKLPQDVPHFILSGNHDLYPEEEWLSITGNKKQGAVEIGNTTFVILDSFAASFDPVNGCTERFLPVDVAFVEEQIEKYPENRVFLCSHYVDMENESEEFKTLLKEETRIKGIFAGHTHACDVLSLGGRVPGSDDRRDRKFRLCGKRGLDDRFLGIQGSGIWRNKGGQPLYRG